MNQGMGQIGKGAKQAAFALLGLVRDYGVHFIPTSVCETQVMATIRQASRPVEANKRHANTSWSQWVTETGLASMCFWRLAQTLRLRAKLADVSRTEASCTTLLKVAAHMSLLRVGDPPAQHEPSLFGMNSTRCHPAHRLSTTSTCTRRLGYYPAGALTIAAWSAFLKPLEQCLSLVHLLVVFMCWLRIETQHRKSLKVAIKQDSRLPRRGRTSLVFDDYLLILRTTAQSLART